MRSQTILRTVLGIMLVCSVTAVAQDKGYWRAGNSNAKAITGDIAISNDKFTIDFLNFTIASIRNLTPDEVLATFPGDSTPGVGGNLYRLDISASHKFLHRNSLCGSDDTVWMVTYVWGRSLDIAFFSGEKLPVFTPDAITNSTALCGVFSYVR